MNYTRSGKAFWNRKRLLLFRGTSANVAVVFNMVCHLLRCNALID